MWAWLIKLIGGWLPIGTKPIGEWLGKILWVVGIVTVCLIGYKQITKPTTNTNQRATNLYNYNYSYKSTFGCMRIPKIEDKASVAHTIIN